MNLSKPERHVCFALAALVLLAFFGECLIVVNSPVKAQGNPAAEFSGVPVNRGTVNASVVITTGNTFQQVLATSRGSTTPRLSLTIENNNANDDCWLFIGSSTPTKATSILLKQGGGNYTRYWPYVPSDVIQATCASNSDTLYVDYQ